MNTINFVAAAQTVKTAQATTPAFNESTFDLDLRFDSYSRDSFQQVNGEYALVIFNGGTVRVGKTEAMAAPTADKILRPRLSFTQKKLYLSAMNQALRYGTDGFVPGFQPKYNADEVKGFGVIGFVKDNFAGQDFGPIPNDGQWHEVIARPIVGTGEMKSFVTTDEVRYQTAQRKDALEFLAAGFILEIYLPANLDDWMAVSVGWNQAVIDNDEGLQAIYQTHYNEAKFERQLNDKARKELSGLSDEEKVEKANSGTLVVMSVDGNELNVRNLGDGSVIRLQDSRGNHKGQIVWNPANAYTVQKMREAAKNGMEVEVIFNTRG